MFVSFQKTVTNRRLPPQNDCEMCLELCTCGVQQAATGELIVDFRIENFITDFGAKYGAKPDESVA